VGGEKAFCNNKLHIFVLHSMVFCAMLTVEQRERKHAMNNMSYQERLNRFEIAQETIGFMMAMRTAAIYDEKKKTEPDTAKIAQWEQEFNQYRDEQHNLRLKDDAAIQRVLDEYCPIVKADYERRRAAAAA
jgi:hypothetical protein